MLNFLFSQVKNFIFPLNYLVYSLVKRLLVWLTLGALLITGRNMRFRAFPSINDYKSEVEMKAWTINVNSRLDSHNPLSILQNNLLAVKIEAASLQQSFFFRSEQLKPHQHPAILAFILVNFDRFYVLATYFDSLSLKFWEIQIADYCLPFPLKFKVKPPATMLTCRVDWVDDSDKIQATRFRKNKFFVAW